MTIACIIPARLNSSRFPGKLLAKLTAKLSCSMRFSKLFVNVISLLTIQTLVASPLADIPDMPACLQHVPQNNSSDCVEENNKLFSYDDVLELLEEIEDGDFESLCSPEELEGIHRFIALLAKQGLLPGDLMREVTLNQDIEDLLSQNP